VTVVTVSAGSKTEVLKIRKHPITNKEVRERALRLEAFVKEGLTENSGMRDGEGSWLDPDDVAENAGAIKFDVAVVRAPPSPGPAAGKTTVGLRWNGKVEKTTVPLGTKIRDLRQRAQKIFGDLQGTVIRNGDREMVFSDDEVCDNEFIFE